MSGQQRFIASLFTLHQIVCLKIGCDHAFRKLKAKQLLAVDKTPLRFWKTSPLRNISGQAIACELIYTGSLSSM